MGKYTSNDSGQESSSTPLQQMGEQPHLRILLQKALVNLCWEISLEWYGRNKNFMFYRCLNHIAHNISTRKTFDSLVGEAKDLLSKTLEEAERRSNIPMHLLRDD
jgi:hypothetical protein